MKSDTLNLVVSESGSNFIKYTNGFIIQWGWGIGTITFPKPFRNSAYGVSVTRNYQSWEWVPTCDDKTATNMLIRTCDKSANYRASGSTLQWTAMGF